MDFGLSDDQELFRRTVREFAAGVLAPAAAAADEAGAFAPETLRQTAEVGLLGMLVPEQHGGAGVDTLGYALAMEEVARACAAMATVLNVNNALVCEPLLRAGSAAQQARWLPALCRGEALGAFCLSEPETGSDVASTQTRAGGWRLDGQKTWVTNGGLAGVYVVFAATTPEAQGRGLSAFLVEEGAAGLSIGPPLEKLGIRGSVTTDLTLTDCRVGADALLGRRDEGFGLAMQTLELGRIGIAAQALGIAQASLDAALAYAQEREQFGRPIAEFQGLRWMLADMALAVDAARLLTYRAAWLRDAGQPYGRAAAMAKLHASETAMQVATKAIQVHGGYGYMRESPVQRYFRDAKITEIYEGTSEIQRIVIAADLLPSRR
jgi:butyryl-CoA dehydrogenase